MNAKTLMGLMFPFMAGGNRKLPILYGFLVLLILILVLSAHVLKLDSIPQGLYFDESTIGYEASVISQTGFDQYGGRIPIYFKSEADYDSPILIYATALIFRIFGISEYTLRLTNALFFTAALLLTVWLATRVFKGTRTVWIYLLIAFGFLPQFFTISRLSFEVISQLACTAAACLSIWWTFQKDVSDYHEHIKASVCGFVIGVSTYTYSTASLLSALMLFLLWAIYLSRKNLKKLVFISSACLITLIPYAIFILDNPGAFTSRFHEISYIYEPISLVEKVGIFFSNYFAYWSPGFLVLHGDTNLRHSTGQGGMMYFVVIILCLVGLIGIVLRRDLDKFKLFLILNLLAAPAAAALTSEGTPHTVRGLLLGYYIVLISCYGLKYLLEINNSWAKISSLVCVFILLLYEVVNYQVDYFIYYPARSVDAFGSYNLRGSLEFAVKKKPKEIILFNNFAGGSENLQFYMQIVDNPNNIPIQSAPVVSPAPGVCVIYRRLSGAEEELDKYSIPYIEFRSRHQPTLLEKQFGAKPFSGIMKTRCYKSPN